MRLLSGPACAGRRFVALLSLAASAAACGSESEEMGPEAVFEDVTAEVSENVSTVVTVRWTTEEPSTGYVEYGPTKDVELVT
ncbi:MAG TPA: hypothetical protein VFZ53_34850, partial [Polyangiaceae bacterium]